MLLEWWRLENPNELIINESEDCPRNACQSVFNVSSFPFTMEMKMCKFRGALRFKSVFGWVRTIVQWERFGLRYYLHNDCKHHFMTTPGPMVKKPNCNMKEHILVCDSPLFAAFSWPLSDFFHFLFLAQQQVSLFFLSFRLNIFLLYCDSC